MDSKKLGEFQSSYDQLAEEYARRIYGELAGKPLDRELLNRFAARLQGSGPVCDLGCGPGHVTRYLQEHGIYIFGLDLSHGMLEHARKLNPGLEFRQGNMLALDADAESWAAIVAFYSIIHIPRSDLPTLFQGLHRVLKPGGLLFLAFHIGLEDVRLEEEWGVPVQLDFYFFHRREIEQHMRSAGFFIEDSLEREPYPEVEVATRRAYILAVKKEA